MPFAGDSATGASRGRIFSMLVASPTSTSRLGRAPASSQARANRRIDAMRSPLGSSRPAASPRLEGSGAWLRIASISERKPAASRSAISRLAWVRTAWISERKPAASRPAISRVASVSAGLSASARSRSKPAVRARTSFEIGSRKEEPGSGASLQMRDLQSPSQGHI
jgi:hypothetical protein